MVYLARWFLCTFTAGFVGSELWCWALYGREVFDHMGQGLYWPYSFEPVGAGLSFVLCAALYGTYAGIAGVVLGALVRLLRT